MTAIGKKTRHISTEEDMRFHSSTSQLRLSTRASFLLRAGPPRRDIWYGKEEVERVVEGLTKDH
jgi:hypothetical protein